MSKYIRWFDEISIKDIPLVGGKNASLGEMYQAWSLKGISIPPGFALTADAFTLFISENNLASKIYPMLADLNPQNTEQLSKVGHGVRALIRSGKLPLNVQDEIKEAYTSLSRHVGTEQLDVAVRSSATAEDLPSASFAGLQETFLNIRGEEDLLIACVNCFASLFTDRAISYQRTNGFDHSKIKLSVGIQQMVRSDLASSGVMFTLDTESGANNIILINSSYGLGENIVGGKVDPDEFVVLKSLLGKPYIPILRRKLGAKQLRMTYSGHGSRTTKNIEVSPADREKFSLNDKDIITLADWAFKIEHYYSEYNRHSTPMDIEWAKDGRNGALYIIQARPETIYSTKTNDLQTSTFILDKRDKVLLTGRAVGAKIGAGNVKIIRDVTELNCFKEGNVLVADMTDPDWEPIMKKASAIITNRGGRTCHAAIVSREHGVPCIVGTGNATNLLRDEHMVTVSCAEGDEGYIYEGILPFHEEKINWSLMSRPKTKIMVNLGNPAQALKTSLLPVDGVGLARMEFIISELVKIHPMALIHFGQVDDKNIVNKITELLGSYRENPRGYFVDKLVEGIGMIAGAFFPRPVIVRFSDFKTNEYASLIGGKQFEPIEENPMIGFRGASRYYDPRYSEAFALECQAIKRLREVVGLLNIKVMIPFCRSPEEGEKVLQEMKRNNLVQGENSLEVYVMSELPANILRADDFSKVFDGFSIGSNDLTQMVLGVDRDSGIISNLFNERDPAVLTMFTMAITAAKNSKKPIGICGQAPSDYPEISKILVEAGIDSISVTADSVLNTLKIVSGFEKGPS